MLFLYINKTRRRYALQYRKFKLAGRRKLNFHEIKQQGQEYFKEKFVGANELLTLAKIASKEDFDALVPKVELLRDITKRICEVKIGENGERE